MRAWVLNLDAETELATIGSHTRSKHLQRIVAGQSGPLLGSLVPAGDLVVTPQNAADLARSGAARGLVGICWSPTKSARKLLESVGAKVPAAPGQDVLAQVNARPFATAVREGLGELALVKHTVHDLEHALSILSSPAESGWLVRRSFGAAGRGRRRLAPGRPDGGELAFLMAALREGPLTIEPFVRILREFTRSGWVTARGEVLIAAPAFQETTRDGAWIRTEAAARHEVAGAHDLALQGALEVAGRALAAQGYFGPFGIDAFLHGSPRAQRLNPLSEINARYTMDWSPAFPGRPDLAAH